MAIVTRYFSTTSAGAGDGTSWADRAALLSAGAFSTVITGFNFSGSDSLQVAVGPGTYTVTTGLTTGAFSNAPTANNPIIWHGCDSSGVLLSPSDPNWTSDLPAWDDSTLPVLETTTNIATITGTTTGWYYRLIKFTASGRQGAILSNVAGMDWCVVANTTSNNNTINIHNPGVSLFNCVLTTSGSGYSSIVSGTITVNAWNCRLVGVAGSTGNRHGFSNSSSSSSIRLCTIISVGGHGISITTSGSTQVFDCTILNCGGAGVSAPGLVMGSYIANCGTYGIDASLTGNSQCFGSRLRDNTAGNFNGSGNFYNSQNYTTDSDDTEFVNSAAGNYQIKSSATIWGQGFGVSEQASGALLMPLTFGGGFNQ